MEATRGNGYAPVRGMPTMMMMMNTFIACGTYLWSVCLSHRDAIVAEKCTYKMSPSKIEVTLMKSRAQKWSTLKALTALGTVTTMLTIDFFNVAI